MLITGVFLFELVSLCVLRMRRGDPPWIRSRDHFALRLQAHGRSRLRVDLVSWAVASLLCAASLLAWTR